MIQRSQASAPRRVPRLVGLLWREAGYYAYGDGEQQWIEPRAAGRPSVIAEIRSDDPYSLIALSVEPLVPESINAFITSAPIFRYRTSHRYDLAFQFFTIPDRDYQRVIGLPRDERMLGGYFPAKGGTGMPF